jgi:hypothetical protein
MPFRWPVLCLITSACVGEGTFPDWGVHETRVLHPRGAGNAGEGWGFDVAVPTGVARERLALAAEGRLVLHPRASVESEARKELATVAGLREVSIGEGARVGTVYGGLASTISLGERTTIAGYVKASAGVEASAGVQGREPASIALGVREGVADPGEYYEWQVTPPPMSTGAPLVVQAGLQTVEPGTYSSLVLDEGGSVALRAGHHFFLRLELRGGSLLIDDSNGPVYVWVKDELVVRSAVRCPEHAKFMLGYAGGGVLPVGAGFCGMLVAPSAALQLFDASAAYTGSFFAESIDLAEGVSVRHDPFRLLPW